METFKIVERETKTKAYSKEGLCSISGGFFSGFLYTIKNGYLLTATTNVPVFIHSQIISGQV